MPKEELNTSDVISNHSELNFSHYSPSPKARSYPKLSDHRRDTSRRSDRSLREFSFFDIFNDAATRRSIQLTILLFR